MPDETDRNNSHRLIALYRQCAGARICFAGSVYGAIQNTRFGFVCAEADYLLKHLALGLIESPVKKVYSYHKMSKRPGKNHRFSLETMYDAIVGSRDGNAFELRGPSLMVNTGLLKRLGT